MMLNVSRLMGRLALGLALIFASMHAAGATMQQPPGSRVQMDVPDKFEVSKLFSGFVYPPGAISVIIAELPTTQLKRISSGLTDAALAKRGMVVTERGKLKRDDEHIYLTATQTARGQEFKKHVLLIKDARSVAVVTANVPTSSFVAGYVKPAEIITALTSARFTDKPAPIIKQFSLGNLGPFKEAGKLMGSAILYTTDGKLRPPKPGISRNMVIVAPSVDRVAVDDTEAFSKRALKAIGGYRDVAISETKAVEIGGLSGTRVAAAAVHASDSKPVEMLQVVLARKSGGYFRLLAIINKDEGEALLKPADDLMMSFKPKP